MSKKSALLSGLDGLDRRHAPPPARAHEPAAATANAPARPSSREGKVQIAAFFPEDVRAQLKILAAEQRRDVQDLLAEGLNLVFVKYGKPEIAG